jgi:hypothetical protein
MVTKRRRYRDTELRDIVVRAAEFLCKENQHGAWLDARTDATCIWAISNCGLAESHGKFVKNCIVELIEDCTRDDDGLRWNEEVWDTALCTMAINSGGGEEYSHRLKEIDTWLLEEYSEAEQNFHNEPWESMWAVMVMLHTAELTRRRIKIIRDSISWVLSKRNSEGVLIAPHYAGLLLTVLNTAGEKVKLNKGERFLYEKAIQDNFSYLMNEFEIKYDQEALWNDEPWSTGLILYGLASCGELSKPLYRNRQFNRFLKDWCSNEWDPSIGWNDTTDTSGLLLGLSEYHIKRELDWKTDYRSGRKAVQKDLAASVKFEFREIGIRRMTVYPIWKKRDFTLQSNKCCILMPYSQEAWSDEVHVILKETLEKHNFQVERADDKLDTEILEGIWNIINESRIVIADCTGANPNVLYEVGIAHTIGKDVIFISQDIKQIPYDIHSKRVLEYNLENARQIFDEKLPEIIDHIKTGKK